MSNFYIFLIPFLMLISDTMHSHVYETNTSLGREGENYCIQFYLSFIQHKTLKYYAARKLPFQLI